MRNLKIRKEPRVRVAEPFSCAATRSAFTLVEILLSLGIVLVLISLLAPALSASRREAKLLGCLTNARSLNQIVATYSYDYRGLAPSLVGDGQEELAIASKRRAYLAYPVLVFQTGPVLAAHGSSLGPRQVSCPWNQVVRDNLPDPNFRVDYSLSAATYLDAAYLSPSLSQDLWNPFRAKIQFLDAATFPSAKATVFEKNVWHAWTGSFGPNAPITDLQPRWTRGRISTSFADGHAEQLWRDEVIESVNRIPAIPYQDLDLTPWGIRGGDKR